MYTKTLKLKNGVEIPQPGLGTWFIVDGRAAMPSVFDGRDMNYPLTQLKLCDVKKFLSGAVWLRYQTK